MKKIHYLILLLGLAACKKDEAVIPTPSNVANLQAEPRVGGALLRWSLPADSNFLYVEVRYVKKDKVVTTKVSKYTDSVLIEGLLNRLDYTFEVQPFNATPKGTVGGAILKSDAVKPIRRPIKISYFGNDLTKITGITAVMLETYTQEVTEGPKANLIDGDKNTYWHTAWSSNTAPLPHWIKISFPQPTNIGVIKYFLRQSTDASGRPNRFALETSEDGTTWIRQWTSAAGLPVDPVSDEKTLALDKNYTSKYFRVMILANPGNRSFTHLGDISFYTMKEEPTDLEELAEANY